MGNELRSKTWDDACRRYESHTLHGNSARTRGEPERVRNSLTRSHLSNHNLMPRTQDFAVGLVWKCDTSPRNFERAGSPGERAGTEDGRNRNSGGYLGVMRSCILARADHMRGPPRVATCCGRLLLAEFQWGSGAHQLEP